MSREEAIAILKNEKPCNDKTLKYSDDVLILALDMAIKALEQESSNEMVHVETLRQVMWERDIAIGQLRELGYSLGQKIETSKDAISRQAVLDYLFRPYSNEELYSNTDIAKFIKELPPVIPQPKIGYWRPIYQGDEIIGYRCSECEFGKTRNTHRANYCHNCGARMRKKSEDNE